VISGKTTKVCSTPDFTNTLTIKTISSDGATKDRDILAELDRLNAIIEGNATSGNVVINTAGGKWSFEPRGKLNAPKDAQLDNVRTIRVPDGDFYLKNTKADATWTFGENKSFTNHGNTTITANVNFGEDWRLLGEKDNIVIKKGDAPAHVFKWFTADGRVLSNHIQGNQLKTGSSTLEDGNKGDSLYVTVNGNTMIGFHKDNSVSMNHGWSMNPTAGDGMQLKKGTGELYRFNNSGILGLVNNWSIAPYDNNFRIDNGGKEKLAVDGQDGNIRGHNFYSRDRSRYIGL
jgi:hypothetical protein